MQGGISFVLVMGERQAQAPYIISNLPIPIFLLGSISIFLLSVFFLKMCSPLTGKYRHELIKLRVGGLFTKENQYSSFLCRVGVGIL